MKIGKIFRLALLLIISLESISYAQQQKKVTLGNDDFKAAEPVKKDESIFKVIEFETKLFKLPNRTTRNAYDITASCLSKFQRLEIQITLPDHIQIDPYHLTVRGLGRFNGFAFGRDGLLNLARFVKEASTPEASSYDKPREFKTKFVEVSVKNEYKTGEIQITFHDLYDNSIGIFSLEKKNAPDLINLINKFVTSKVVDIPDGEEK